MMAESAGVAQVEKTSVTSLQGERQQAVRLEPIRRGHHDLAEVAKVDQRIASDDQLEILDASIEPFGDLSDL
ncbi:MAG: hypothetical protein O3A53_19430 [Acidobacteria bacterium]|nr:hypothetical protein [Acidobacteriota bacterium]MDA1236954.1 hypothetical protein [Acidobacteriota bacterium]